jgi:hypothetical protein
MKADGNSGRCRTIRGSRSFKTWSSSEVSLNTVENWKRLEADKNRQLLGSIQATGERVLSGLWNFPKL